MERPLADCGHTSTEENFDQKSLWNGQRLFPRATPSNAAMVRSKSGNIPTKSTQ